MTKIDIISGFLGAGKTTFIKKLLEEAIAGEKVVLIENEFGEIGIDGGFLKDSGIEIREMNSGCICCSLVGDFGRSLAEVLEKYSPDRVIIEPSGVGKLSDVMKAVCDVAGEIDVALNGSITVVDAQKCKMYMKNFGEFFNNQIESAGMIVLSRTDVANADKVAEAVEMIREKNPKAVIVTTPIASLTGAQLLDIIERPMDDMAADLLEEVKHHHHDEDEECCCGHDHHHHHHHGHDADEVFTSWGLETSRTISREKLDAVLEDLAHSDKYGQVLRAKGMLPDVDGTWYYFDLVPEEVEIRTGSPIYTGKVCVIGSNLKEDELKEVFGK
ncbi:MAG: GTP-binding protein [Lachnospiraceae bacterium]|nr:GTP-binding protein [Lachnospiraceae bacterium]